MDFRVYLDGAQRIVSGVTLETTCKDIVLCLAQSTQQFGKFILVERWRNNERLLNPNEHPIKLLSQWGDYASDVMFIMKRCDQPLNEMNAKLPTSVNPNHLQLQNQIIQQQLQLQQQQQQQQQQSRQYQSNDSNSIATRVNQNNRIEGKQLMPTTNLNVENHDHYGTYLSQKHVYHQEDKLINTPNKSIPSTPLSQNSMPPELPTEVESDYGTNQALKRPKHPPPYYEAITKSALLRSSPSDPVSESGPEASGLNGHQWSKEETPSLSKCSKETNRCSNCEDEDVSQRTLKLSRNPEESRTKQIYRPDETKSSDVKLSNLQKDTLNANNRQILEITSPVSYWDSKYRSPSVQPNRQDVMNENRRINERSLDIRQESMNNMVSDVTNEEEEEEMVRLYIENRGVEIDKSKLRVQLSEIENQITDCRHSIEHLMDQINQLNLQKEEEEMLKRREEEKIKAQLIEMTKEKRMEFERQSEQFRIVDSELKESDEMLKERIKKIEKILHDLKETNLQGLNLLPRDELFSKNNPQMKTSQSHVIINPDARNSFQAKQQRPGSTRKMFVPPRELKNAVATSKNPHGVWV
ncbi:ras association domain-containing protein 8-like [Panonychus citri]|uniref:ras association domain-containing protein 8-like n=1 Tax=Panonychus citri TaxID=50023 RepID=UPI0023071360|nr:ras association domain-containing protein 8-like [Panonychus citri]